MTDVIEGMRGSRRTAVVVVGSLLIALMAFALQPDSASAQEESYTLTVSTQGGGKVTGPGIDCGNGGTDCSETYLVTYDRQCAYDEDLGRVVCEDVPVYQDVTLNASPTSGWRFQDWGGDCSGAQSTCALTMDANHSVSASWVQLPPNGRIAFQTNRDGNDEIYVMNADGTGQTRITNNSEIDRQPAYSPDGTKIAFSGQGRLTSNGDIYVMNANGTGKTFLTDSLWFDGHPAYSPDGSRIAFVSQRDENYEVYAMNADGSGQTNLTNSPTTVDTDPSYSSDGQKITFHRDGDIWVMNSDGVGKRALTNDPAPDANPVFSPDGTKIAFTSFRDGNYEIYTMNADGSGEENITDNAAQDDLAAYSPDGTKIAFNRDRDMWVMNADGTGQTRLTQYPPDAIFPSWGPANTSVPETTITSSDYSGPVNSTSQRFFFSSGPDTIFECKLDGGAFEPCESPKGYADLAEGSHTFQVRAINAAGNADPTPATHAWTVDTVAPDTTITSGPSEGSTVNSKSATFGFTSNEPGATFECKIDNSIFGPCSSPRSFDFLSEGTHTFTVRASDGANTDPTPASRSWTVDAPPETTITSFNYPGSSGSVNGWRNSTSASFGFTSNEPGTTFECRLTRQGETAGAFTACASPKEYTGLTDGRYTFEVRARDGAGNVDPSPAGDTWKVDATPPSLTITSGPAEGSVVNSSSASFAFSASDASSGVGSVRCRLDDGVFGPCSDGVSSHSVAGLADGQHTFQVRATDIVGNSTTTSRTWTVDTSAPETTLDPSGPTGTVNTDSAGFAFTSTETGSTFECKLDSAAFAPCVSPKSYTGLPDGSHVFEVRARDGAGNIDTSPASRAWTVNTAPADTTAPRVRGVTPLANATGVAPSANVKATFSEAMKVSTITKSTFKLFRINTNGTTTRITDVTVALSPEGLTATLDPFGTSATQLAANTSYKATITTGATDLAGNALDQNASLSGNQAKSWRFTTGGAVQ